MVRKDDWNDFSFFEFTKARFMAQEVIYSGEVSVCTWEKGEIRKKQNSSPNLINYKWLIKRSKYIKFHQIFIDTRKVNLAVNMISERLVDKEKNRKLAYLTWFSIIQTWRIYFNSVNICNQVNYFNWIAYF